MGKCKLFIQYTYHPAPITPDPAPRVDQVEFNNIAHLSNYLQFESDKAFQLGYGKGMMPHENKTSKSTDVKLILQYKDDHSVISAEFVSAHAFARFLDRNQDIAECVGYTRKG